MKKYSHVTYDHKQGGCEDEWGGALKAFSLVLTEDPMTEGSDQYGYFITEGKPTDPELREIRIDCWGPELISISDMESE